MPDINKDATSGQQPQGTPSPQGAGAAPGAAQGTQGTGATGTGGGSRPKDNKTGTQGAGGSGTRKDTKGAPPPPAFGTPPPQLQVLQLTPELFQQTVSAAVTAALAADRQSSRSPATVDVTAAAQAQGQAVIPRKEKKLAEFWTTRPTMWFRLFDGQFPDTMSEDSRFNALLNHLPSAALPFVDHILRAPGTDPFAKAKACLVRHYEVSPRDRARTLRSLTSLGDRTPSEMLYYMRSLLPGYPDNPLFEAIFIDLLPANARDAAVKHDVLEDMAEAADKVLAEAPAVSVVSSIDGLQDGAVNLSQVVQTPKKSKDPSLCYVHNRYGRGAFRCASPRTCRMKDIIIKPAPGNSNAGRQ